VPIQLLKRSAVCNAIEINDDSSDKFGLIGSGVGDEVDHDDRLSFQVGLTVVIIDHVGVEFERFVEGDFAGKGFASIFGGVGIFGVAGFPLDEEGAGEFDVGGAFGGFEFEEAGADLLSFGLLGHIFNPD
jgi:hypothetical protein